MNERTQREGCEPWEAAAVSAAFKGCGGLAQGLRRNSTAFIQAHPRLKIKTAFISICYLSFSENRFGPEKLRRRLQNFQEGIGSGLASPYY
jgi:hypothetical protein